MTIFCYTLNMARSKEKPNENPSWTHIRQAANSRERQEMDMVSREFAFGTFKGRVVAQWCVACGTWKTHYVSAVKAEAMTKAVDGFTPETENFSCSKCQRQLPIVLDAAHTILRNV